MGAAEKIIGPGLYLRSDRIPYGSINAVNFSTIKHFADSARHYRHRIRNPAPDTVGQLKGTASHTAVLEPHKLFTEYAVFDPHDLLAEYAVFEGDDKRGSKAWKAFEAENEGKKLIKRSELEQALDSDRRGTKLWKEFAQANDGKRLIKRPELEQALAIRDAVRSDAAAMRYLEKGYPEVTLVWVDAETGLLCKARLDWVSHEHVILDLKGTANASQWTFGSEAYRRQYHVQQAFYLDGYETLFPQSQPTSKILAVEYNPPHDSVVFNLPDEVLGIGRDCYRRYLNQLAECRGAGEWPGRSGGTEMDLMLPKYAWPDESDLDGLGLEME